MDKETIKKYSIATWDIIKNIIEFVLPIAGFILISIVGLSILAMPFVAIGRFIEYLGSKQISRDIEPIKEVAIQVPSFLDSILNLVSLKSIQIFVDYPYFTVMLFLIFIYILIKIMLKRGNSSNFFKSLFILIIISYIFYLLTLNHGEQFKNISNLLSIFFTQLFKFVDPTYEGLIEINFGRQQLLVGMYIILAYWLNNRLLWILSIAIVQIYIFHNYYDQAMIWMNTLHSDYFRLLQGILPVLLATPYILSIWIFRDNDKYSDFQQRELELSIRRREANIKESELKTKENELKIRKSELELKEKELKEKDKS